MGYAGLLVGWRHACVIIILFSGLDGPLFIGLRPRPLVSLSIVFCRDIAL